MASKIGPVTLDCRSGMDDFRYPRQLGGENLSRRRIEGNKYRRENNYRQGKNTVGLSTTAVEQVPQGNHYCRGTDADLPADPHSTRSFRCVLVTF